MKMISSLWIIPVIKYVPWHLHMYLAHNNNQSNRNKLFACHEIASCLHLANWAHCEWWANKKAWDDIMDIFQYCTW